MIRIAIVEDEASFAQLLQNYLKQYEEEHKVFFQISTFSDGLDIVTDYSANYDIILLDIQMKHLDGMRTAQKIRELDDNVDFIFITSTIQFAVQGYTVDAMGYVLKPVSYISFSQLLEKAIQKTLSKQQKFYFTVNVDGGQLRLESAQIYYVESQKHYILIHSDKGNHLTAGPLKRLEDLLSPQGYAKCHNAYLINLQHVVGILQNTVELTDGSMIPISRTRKKEFMDRLTDYMGGM